MNIFTECKAVHYVWNIKNMKFSHAIENLKPAGTEESYGNVASISVLRLFIVLVAWFPLSWSSVETSPVVNPIFKLLALFF